MSCIAPNRAYQVMGTLDGFINREIMLVITKIQAREISRSPVRRPAQSGHGLG